MSERVCTAAEVSNSEARKGAPVAEVSKRDGLAMDIKGREKKICDFLPLHYNR